MESPTSQFQERQQFLATLPADIVAPSMRAIETEYPNRSVLEDCLTFAAHDLAEASPGDVESLIRVGFFPWTEASWEIDQAANLALLGYHKASNDHARRALELVLVGSFFASSAGLRTDARAWMQSKTGTPYFSRTLDKLLAVPRYRQLHEACKWADTLKADYWAMSDAVHVRGTRASYRAGSAPIVTRNGLHAPVLDSGALMRSLDTVVMSVRHCASMMAALNPVLLVGFPIDEKFGFNPPISGFLRQEQSERLWRLLPDATVPFFRECADTEGDVRSAVEWFANRPDLTEDELAEQADEVDRMMASMERKPTESSAS